MRKDDFRFLSQTNSFLPMWKVKTRFSEAR